MNLKTSSPAWIVLAALCCASGCRDADRANAEPKRVVLRVAAASDLRAALPVVIEQFRSETGIEVDATYGSSGQLAEQIKQGAPFDVFLSADRSYVESLEKTSRLRKGSAREYATGPLVLAVRESLALEIKTLDDLIKPSVGKIAIANPRFAPYGRAAKQALERAKVWDRVADKIIEAESVRHALQFVESGNADAALVALAIADVPHVQIRAIDPTLHEPIVQTLGIVADTKNLDVSERFSRFLLGRDGRERLARFGFQPPPNR